MTQGRHLNYKLSPRRKFKTMGIRVKVFRHAFGESNWGDVHHMLDLVEESAY